MSVRHRVKRALHRNLREEDLGKAAIALSLALLTVLAAVVAGLQGQASIMSAQGNRSAQAIGIQAIGDNASHVIQVGSAYGVYRTWFEQIERSNWATQQQTLAVNASNKPEIDALQGAESSIETWTKSQTDLLQLPYYNGTDADFDAYEADKLVGPETLSAEQRAIEADVASEWDGKASDYVTVLTVLAVALFFLGLASTVGRRARPLLAGAGILFGVGALVWTITIASAPIHRVPQDAVDQVVASAVALAKTPTEQGVASLSDKARKGYQAAIDAADKAIGIDPTYTSAYRLAGEARVGYADSLYFSSGPSDEVQSILHAGVDDYRQYLTDNPSDYAGWWNLGWAYYLGGDQFASVDATNQALVRSPAQFTLYLNRALAFLAGGDQQQAAADVDEAIRRAGTDSSDSAQYYVGQSDYDIGRLATLYPNQAAFLRDVQVRLREANVSLRVSGTVTPAAGAPKPANVTVTPVQLKVLAGGTLVEGQPLADGAQVQSTDAVGVRVTIPDTSALAGHTVSTRVWVNGLPESDYNHDVTVAGTNLSIDLVSPYGEAGFNLDPGTYQVDVYVDGARDYTLSWTVQPAPDKPQYQITAQPFLTGLQGVGFQCDNPTTASDGKTSTNCSVLDTDQTTYIADITWDQQDRITEIVLGVSTPADSTADINALTHQFYDAIAKQLFPADVATRASAWLDKTTDKPDDDEVGGTQMRVYGADAHTRNLDIWSPWP
jgi:tetratricopeptide (TPR) repeat protein